MTYQLKLVKRSLHYYFKSIWASQEPRTQQHITCLLGAEQPQLKTLLTSCSGCIMLSKVRLFYTSVFHGKESDIANSIISCEHEKKPTRLSYKILTILFFPLKCFTIHFYMVANLLDTVIIIYLFLGGTGA